MLVTCVRRFATGLSPPKVQRVYKPTFDRGLLGTALASRRRPSPAALESAASKEDLAEFSRFFPDVVRDLTEAGRHLDAPSGTRRLAQILQHCVPTGKKNRGLALVLSYRLLARHEDMLPHASALVNVMGWCLEMLHTSMLMTQDLLDDAEARRGRPCWFREPEMQQAKEAACNDAALLHSAIYQLLTLHFRQEPYYLDVLELFHDVSHKANIGQVMDLETRADKTLDLFTMDRYQVITKYKTAYHTFQMPVSLALYMAGIRDMEIHRQAKTILMEMGQFYQVLDDFVDCYGPDHAHTNDIEDGKCTWLAVVALQRASDKQKRLLQECYGSKEPAKVERVKQLYDALGVAATYKVYADQGYELLCKQIQQTSRGLPHKLFFKFLDKIYVKDS